MERSKLFVANLFLPYFYIILQARFHLKEKYRARYAEMHRKFVSEREEMLRLIRDECQDIISEAQLLLIKKRSGMLESFDDSFLRAKPESVFDEHLTTVSSSGIKMPANEFVMTGASFLRQSVESNTSKHSHGTIHAEMLSPKETQDLVRSVLEKVSVNAWKEFQSAYNSGGPSTSSVDFAEEGIN